MSEADKNSQDRSTRSALEAAADNGSILDKFTSYLDTCRSKGNENNKKSAGKIPNVAGFCRFIGATLPEFDRLKMTRPELHGALCAALEDEALNSSMPASILSVYLKLRLGYTSDPPEPTGVTDSGQLRLIFDHDAYRDGE
jgi:hypothetical protein